MDRFIVRKIRQLKRVQPDSSWLETQKNFLLSEISRVQKEKREPSLVLPLFNFNILKIFKPSFAIALGIIILATSFITIGVISASQNSLSGDFLYPLKTAFEKTQLTFTAGEINKTKLSIKFATQRMDEFTQLINSPEKKKDTEKTVEKFTAQIVSVQKSIDKLKEKNAEKAAEVAKLIQAQILAYEEILIKSNEKLGYVLSIDQALLILSEFSSDKSSDKNPEPSSSEEIVVPAQGEKIESNSPDFENIQTK